MTGSGQLKGRRIAVLVADGFERVELSVPLAALRAESAKVEIVHCARAASAASTCTSPRRA